MNTHRVDFRHLARTAMAGTLCLACAALTSSCGEGPTGPGPAKPITELPRALSSTEQALVQASNAFAVNLLTQVHAAAPDSTVFLSPLSASMALGMTMNGAAGETLDQMRATLGFGSMSLSDVDASYRDLLDLLENLDPTVQLDVANAIFHRNTFQMEQPFLDTVHTYFDAEIQGLDFNDPSAVTTINDWVKQATNGRIDGIVDPPIDPTTMAFLLNAVYFKGDWTKSFDASKTYTGPFHLTDGTTQDVRFMTKKDTLGYRATDAWQAVELPYGGGAFVMTVAVPTAGHTLDDVAADLGTLLDTAGTSGATWPQEVVEVHLPRFQLQWERTLNDDLEALGMVDAFSPENADFTPMYRDAKAVQLHIQTVKQKTFLKVDETGTEAAAVTSVAVGVTVCCAGPPVVKADRPFFLAIRERLSGTVLFDGFIVQAPEG
jgi:serine protease inhibitor